MLLYDVAHWPVGILALNVGFHHKQMSGCVQTLCTECSFKVLMLAFALSRQINEI